MSKAVVEIKGEEYVTIKHHIETVNNFRDKWLEAERKLKGSLPPPPEESTLRELELYAKAWIKYISVATLQGENALTRKGVEDAIKGYSDITKDFTNSLKSLIQERELLARIEELEGFANAKIDHRGEPALFNPDGLPISTPRTEEMTRLVNQAAKDRITELNKQAVKVKEVTK